MVWSKDLAKLKQGLKAQEAIGGAAAQAPAKHTAAPIVAKPLEEEDALFLKAVGKSVSHSATQRHLEGHGQADEFAAAMSQLKGIKPSGPKTKMDSRAGGHAAPQGPKTETKHEKKTEADTMHSTNDVDNFDGFEDLKDIGHKRERDGGDWAKPEEIQLAAGMVIEVDGQLDIRNHNETDARERLAERVLDGQCLGWRSLHVILGNSDSLRQVLLDYLNSPQSAPLAKYAQAPVPMGGNKAWILYYHSH